MVLEDIVCLNLLMLYQKMINQIYHTSHCGSTLLISLLKDYTEAYSEPSWCHNVVRYDLNFLEFISQYNSGVIKLPSGLCNYAHQTEGKKIFLYRKLKQHLHKILSDYRIDYIDYYYSYFRKNIHPSLKSIEFDTIDKMNIFLWANRIMWISECPDIAWIDSNEFLSNKKQTLDFVCDYFEIPRVESIELSNIHVKTIGMNHNNCALGDLSPDLESGIRVQSDLGIISDEMCYNDDRIRQLVEWTHENLPFIPQYLL